MKCALKILSYTISLFLILFQTLTPVYSAISTQEIPFIDLWQGTITTPLGETYTVSMREHKKHLYIAINETIYKTDNFCILPDNTIEFSIKLADNEDSKLYFNGKIDHDSIQGEVKDSSGNIGHWIAQDTKEMGLIALDEYTWNGKITTPDGQRLDLIINTTSSNISVNIANKDFQVYNLKLLPGNKIYFHIAPIEDPSFELVFTGEIIDNWIIAGKVFDNNNKDGSWIVKKDLDEYGFIATKDNTLETGAELTDIQEEQVLPKDNKILIKVKKFDFDPSQIFTDIELATYAQPYTKKVLNPEDIKTMIDKINTEYAKRGYITAKAFLPPQTIEDGVVKITLVEGHIGEITLKDNKYTRDSYILSRLRQKQGNLFKMETLSQDLRKFNRRNTVQLRANLKPGQEFGATDIEIVANDPMPYHLTPFFDNTGRETIGILRGGVMLNSESLFGFRDQFYAGYSRARSTDLAYAGYSVPIGHRGTRAGLNFSYSNIEVTRGDFKNLNLGGEAFNYSGYISQRFITTDRFDLSADMSFNLRDSSTNIDGQRLFKTQVRSLTTGLNFEFLDQYGRWFSRQAFTQGLDVLGGNSSFFHYNGNLYRIHNFGHNVLGIFRASGQVSSSPLPPIEQFQLGGSNTVRGYSEGLLLGDNGYFVSAELRFPLPLPKYVGKLALRDRISGVVFVDHGGAFLKGGGSLGTSRFLTSLGLGLRASLTKYINGRVDWGFGLQKAEPSQPVGRLHFGLEANPF